MARGRTERMVAAHFNLDKGAHMTHSLRSEYLRTGAIAGLLASASMAMTPAHAAELPSDLGTAKHNTLFTEFETPNPGDSLEEVSEWRRWGRWRGRGWRRGWRRHRGVRAGDVLAGVAIIGGIAAIASAANNNNRRDRDDRRRERHRDWERDNELRDLREQNQEQQRELDYLRSRGVDAQPYQGTGASERSSQSRHGSSASIGINQAIDTCTQGVSRDAGPADITGVERAGNGWNVRGRAASGDAFTCSVSGNGSIEAIDFPNGLRSQRDAERYDTGYTADYTRRGSQPLNAANPVQADGQLSDDGYARARIAMDQRSDPRQPLGAGYSDARSKSAQAPVQAQPAYPGGPIPGEVIPETIDGDMSGYSETRN